MEILTHHASERIFTEVLPQVKMPTSSEADELRETTRLNGIRSLYYFSTAVLGWNKVQVIPHRPLCDFIQNTAPPNKRRKVLLVPRDCYKSTIGSKSLPLWILVQPEIWGLPGPEHRILLCSFSSTNAQKQIKSIQQQIERNDMLRWLYPEIIPDLARTTWTSTNLLFPRQGMYGEDTIEAAGVDSHIVSRHYTVQIKDDLEDKQSYEQPTVRERVKSFYKSAEALFVDEREAYDLLIGTRWGVDDVYHDIRVNESDAYEFHCYPLEWTQEDILRDIREAEEFNSPRTYPSMSVEEHAPDPVKRYFFFPELFPEESCRRIRQKQGSFMYSMLYLNNPRDPSMAEFKEEDLLRFSFDTHGDILIQSAEGNEVIPFDELQRGLFWDPALAEKDQKKKARNAIVVVAQDRRGRIFVLDALADFKAPASLFTRYIGFHQRYRVHKAAIEDVAFQKVLKYPLYHRMQELNYIFPVLEERPVGDKDTRIRALLPFAESKMLYIRNGLIQVMEEFKSFPVFPTKDIIDAIAASVVMLKKKYAHGTTSNGTNGKPKTGNVIQMSDTRSAVTGY